jgi:phosphoribosylanthranilate isomerase
MLKTFVKINQVNNLSDARYCAGMAVNDLGFNVEAGTLHYISPEDFKEITDWVAGVRPVAEFTTASTETLNAVINSYAVGAVQVSNQDQLAAAKGYNLPIIYRTTPELMSGVSERLTDDGSIEYFLVETDSIAELDSLVSHLAKARVVVSGNFSAEEFEMLLEKYPQLYGIAMTGGEEIRAGYKDFDALAEVLEALEAEEEF